MNDPGISELVFQIPSMAELTQRPFPSADCYKLIRQVKQILDGLNACLALYFSAIAGYASSAKNIALWTTERKRSARKDLARGFYDQYPQFQIIRPLVSSANVPDLYADFRLYERAREILLTILSKLD